jgi:hypothetical protein
MQKTLYCSEYEAPPKCIFACCYMSKLRLFVETQKKKEIQNQLSIGVMP